LVKTITFKNTKITPTTANVNKYNGRMPMCKCADFRCADEGKMIEQVNRVPMGESVAKH